jgi:hypothetical protein
MKYAAEMGSGVIHTKFHKDWFRHSKVNRRELLTHRQRGDRVSILYESKIKRINIYLQLALKNEISNRGKWETGYQKIKTTKKRRTFEIRKRQKLDLSPKRRVPRNTEDDKIKFRLHDVQVGQLR